MHGSFSLGYTILTTERHFNTSIRSTLTISIKYFLTRLAFQSHVFWHKICTSNIFSQFIIFDGNRFWMFILNAFNQFWILNIILEKISSFVIEYHIMDTYKHQKIIWMTYFTMHIGTQLHCVFNPLCQRILIYYDFNILFYYMNENIFHDTLLTYLKINQWN